MELFLFLYECACTISLFSSFNANRNFGSRDQRTKVGIRYKKMKPDYKQTSRIIHSHH